MTCYYPLHGWRAKKKSPSGRRAIVFKADEGYTDMPETVPCGKCVGCRLDKSREWAVRCVHESMCHTESAFITLTYNEENLPEGATLVKKDFQDFMKRFRQHLYRKFKKKIKEGTATPYDYIELRYYMCGEYGSKNNRPHYHAAIFGYDFQDKEIYKKKDGIPLYKSKELEALWKKGFVTVGQVTMESAAYIARYMMKKIDGKLEEDIGENGLKPYERIDSKTGEIIEVIKEYTDMSRSEGLGTTFYEVHGKRMEEIDTVVIKGKEMVTPQFYMDKLREKDEEKYLQKKLDRKKKINKIEGDLDRLRAKEKVKKAATVTLRRTL